MWVNYGHFTFSVYMACTTAGCCIKLLLDSGIGVNKCSFNVHVIHCSYTLLLCTISIYLFLQCHVGKQNHAHCTNKPG